MTFDGLPKTKRNPRAAKDAAHFAEALDALGWLDPMAALKKKRRAPVRGYGDAVRDAYSKTMRTSVEAHTRQARLRVHLLRASDEAGVTLVVDYGGELDAVLAALARRAPKLTQTNFRALAAEIAQLAPTWLETESGFQPLLA